MLTDINTGRFNGAHPSKLFHQAHAPEGSEFYCWKLSADEMAKMSGVGMHDLWEKLCEAGLAFMPTTASFAGAAGSAQPGQAVCKGVFPMVGLRGLRYQFLAIGEDKTETAAIVFKAKELLATVVRPSVQESPTLMALSEANGPEEIQPLMLELAEQVVSSMPEEFEIDSACDWDLKKLITTPREALEVELPKGGERELVAAALEGVLEMATEDAVTTDMPIPAPAAEAE